MNSTSNIEEALSARIRVIETQIEQLTEESLALSEEKTRLSQARELVRGHSASIETQLTITAPVLPSTPRRVYTKTGAHKGKRTWPKKKAKMSHAHLPWEAYPHAAPHTKKLYDILRNGQGLTARAIWAEVKTFYPKTTLPQVSAALSHMKQTGRLMMADGQYRRKYYRGATQETSTNTPQADANQQLTSVSMPASAIGRLEELASQGALTKVGENRYELGTLPANFRPTIDRAEK